MSIYRLPNANAIHQHIIRVNDDGSESWIAVNELNGDYKDYLSWQAQGNTASSSLLEEPSVSTCPTNEQFLASTDLQVLLHLEECTAGINPTLNNEEFHELVRKRKAARASLVEE